MMTDATGSVEVTASMIEAGVFALGLAGEISDESLVVLIFQNMLAAAGIGCKAEQTDGLFDR
jgi:hypothetical protein